MRRKRNKRQNCHRRYTCDVNYFFNGHLPAGGKSWTILQKMEKMMRRKRRRWKIKSLPESIRGFSGQSYRRRMFDSNEEEEEKLP